MLQRKGLKGSFLTINYKPNKCFSIEKDLFHLVLLVNWHGKNFLSVNFIALQSIIHHQTYHRV